MMAEAKMDSNGNITANGWTRWLVGSLWGVLILFMLGLTNNVIANDKDSRNRDDKLGERITKNEVTIAEIKSIANDVTEIKYLLKRRIPVDK